MRWEKKGRGKKFKAIKDNIAVHHKGGETFDMSTRRNMLLRACYCVRYTSVSKKIKCLL